MLMLAPAHSRSVVCGLSAREGGAPASLRVVCRSGGKVDALPIVESSWRSDTHPMSNDATPTLGGFGSGPSEVSVNQRGYPTVNGVDGAGWRRPSPVAVAQWSSRRRRVVFSLLAGVRLAAGGAALILLGWGIAEALRSPLPVPLVSGSWSTLNLFPLIFIILSLYQFFVFIIIKFLPASILIGFLI